MKLSDVNTLDDFFEFGDIWYQRAHGLRVIWQDENETKETRVKAFKLWLIMYDRVINITPLGYPVRPIPEGFTPGGIVSDLAKKTARK
jgi:hypothetical protein